MPRPNTPVIPTRWSAHHRPAAEATMTATCSIRRPGGVRGEFDAVTGTYPTVPHDPHYAGRCRVQVLGTAEQEQLAAEQELTGVGYLVAVEYDAGAAGAPVRVGDVVTVTAVDDNGSLSLPGRDLTVVSLVRGSTVWQLDLTCVDYLEEASS